MNTVYLINLISLSQSLSDEEKEKLKNKLSEFNDEQIKNLIKIFETEQKKLKEIEDNYNKTMEEIAKKFQIKNWELERKSEKQTKNKLEKIKII